MGDFIDVGFGFTISQRGFDGIAVKLHLTHVLQLLSVSQMTMVSHIPLFLCYLL
jgi:hypothetical protein